MPGRRRGGWRGATIAAAAGALLIVGGTTGPGEAAAAQETPAPEPQQQRVPFDMRTIDVKVDAVKDEVIFVVESLHLVLPDLGIELRADHAVLWGGHEMLKLMTSADAKSDADPLRFGPEVPAAPGRSPLPHVRGDDKMRAALAALREIYAEGHVFFRQGEERVLLADRLYQHLLERRGIIVAADAYGRSDFRNEKVDVHVRAQALRILGPQDLAAEHAQFSTCAYGHPHWHVDADTLSLHLPKAPAAMSRLGPQPYGREESPGAAQIGLSGNALELGDTPVLPLPGFTADLSEGDSLPLKSVGFGHSTKFGGYTQTLWGAGLPTLARALTEEFGLDEPLDLRWEADVDYYAERGLGLGPALDWKVPGLLEGDLGGYWIRDHADEDFSQPFVIDNPDRSRVWFRDRLTPVEYWRLDTEVNWLSDAGLQPEYFEREFKEDKPPETYAHLVRQEETTRLRFLYRERVNDFQTQVEELPEVTFDQVAEPLWRLPLPGFLEQDGRPNYLVLTHYEDFANQRLHPADGSTVTSERVARGDSLFELSTTVPLGPVSFRPFTAGQFTAWDRGTDTDGSIGRSAGIAGAHSELMTHRNFDAWMPSLGIDGLRHVVMFDADYQNVYGVTRDADEIVQIDDVDALKQSEVYLLAIRQRLQTHREGSSDGVRTDSIVNVFEFEVELPLYPHANRDNVGTDDLRTAGETTGPLHFDFVHRPGFTTPYLRNCILFADGDWNLKEGTMDETNLGVQLAPTRDWTTVVGWRATRGISHIVTGQIDWRVADKWSLALFEQYDFDENGALDQRLEVRRHGHDFTFAMGFERDHGDGNTSITFAIYPSFLLRGLAKESFASGRGEGPGLGQEKY